MNQQQVSQTKEQNSDFFCNWCGQPTQLIWVHGHGQCRWCGVNIDECCRGETCQNMENKLSEINKLSQKRFMK